MTDDDVVPIKITTWPGDGEWTGPVEIAYSPDFSGDVIFTLPRAAYHSDTVDGLGIDVSIPLGALRHIVALANEAGFQDAYVRRDQLIAAIDGLTRPRPQ